MGFITDGKGNKLMINRKTGERFLQSLSRKEKLIVKINELEREKESAEEQLNSLQKEGYDLEEIIEALI